VTTRIYAVRVDADRIVAAEVDDRLAATLFDNGHSILLATKAELAQIAKRRQKSLAVILRQRTVLARRDAAPTATARMAQSLAGLPLDAPSPQLALQAR
jgi:hypothetical protein